MSAVRSSSTRALRQLSSHSHQVRHLHMTPSTTFPSLVLAPDKNIFHHLPSDLNGLKAECTQRGISSIGTKDELITRLISPEARAGERSNTVTNTQPKNRRSINTSRALKKPNDTSTIDFAYLPAEPAITPVDNVNLRVPLLPENHTPNRTGAHAHEIPSYESVIVPTVVTAAADSTHISTPSIMNDVHDNTAVAVDFHALAERMQGTMGKVKERARESQGTMKQLWEGVVDDVLGPKQSSIA